ncbi:MAG: peroxiredoxin [Mobiluncus porci]|uniref:thioredoxin-dependent peroxiredoxin n=1 Tax=Mobiluncus porci TaxID=2652278 RepID=A0A7K0K3A3_9ACTO|nr:MULTISPECIES: peroxiredoxin [Mobiluncus]MCI6583813.1 peroxiredoxin [Mobiluncus sp.]MDD7541024.1 peroxiredoxin [Mobiluncus porci]MDY5748199.1 peroxiredoxin [Mobiluncus porci]MST49967.1 peroxiredoxin [Mobiluncus porci]
MEEKLKVGDSAPDFTVETTNGTFALADALKEATAGVVVYFYPRASTPGCTTEACDFRDSLNSLKSAGYTVIGVSPDQMPALEKFTANQALNFALGSDPEREVLEAYGVWQVKPLTKKPGVVRSTFVVGPDGKLIYAKYNVKATGHVARLREALGI